MTDQLLNKLELVKWTSPGGDCKEWERGPWSPGRWRTERGSNPPKFRSFDKAEPNSQFRGKYGLKT
jgi:hypothetical protein